MPQGKVWGSTRRIFAKAGVEVHRIAVDPWRRCSRHSHRAKFNSFFVEGGKLIVEIWKLGGLVDRSELRAGDSIAIAPGVVHRFSTDAQGALAFEVYWVELDPSDIERLDAGGIIEEKATS